ncbi:MAG: hypothetical protein H3C35_00330 [Bacteroidetes bacterium]|nr:hypothetical protein [Bacteroidota bacterium]
MKFARNIFAVAGFYGILITLPMYFSESSFNTDYPPAITHPEYFYGFISVTFAWQILFLFIAVNPFKYRLLMIPAMLEKLFYASAIFWLYAVHRVSFMTIIFAAIDLVLLFFFLAAFVALREKRFSDDEKIE